jgi:hypothetical protein
MMSILISPSALRTRLIVLGQLHFDFPAQNSQALSKPYYNALERDILPVLDSLKRFASTVFQADAALQTVLVHLLRHSVLSSALNVTRGELEQEKTTSKGILSSHLFTLITLLSTEFHHDIVADNDALPFDHTGLVPLF